MKLFSSKKAQGEATEETIYPIIGAAIAIFMMVQLLSAINGLSQNTFFHRGFLERDIASVIDSLYASPGNIIIDYDKDTSWFSFIFGENSVNAYENQDILIPDNVVYYFTPDKMTGYSTMEFKAVFRGNQPSEENLIEGVNLMIAKTDKTLRIDKLRSQPPNLNEIECFEVKNAQRFSESPSKGFNDVDDIDDTIEMNYARDYEVFLWYYPGEYDEAADNTIKAFISSDTNLRENRRLACLIVNQLLDKLNRAANENNLKAITSAAIIPTDSWQMLNEEGYLSVLLEIGNKNIAEEKNIWGDEESKNAILESIDTGVKSYG